MQGQNFFEELKRRNVFRVATAYAIAGWLIIQICTSTFPHLNIPGWIITAVIIFVAIGFPIALIFAWAFELTPEGLKKTAEVNQDQSVTQNTGRKINRLIITSLSLLVFFLLVERVFFAKSSIIEADDTDVHAASIAVLPFVNMSSDAENEYFSDGLSEELLNGLAQVEGMKVAGRTSSFKFKGQNENLSLIADELGVNHILEGSVRKDGNRVRITAQLIQADNGFHLWSETYDRELNDIFAIQDEISRTVLKELKVRLLPEDEAEMEVIPTTDVEAYQAFLKANQLVVNRDIDEINVAIELYLTALKLDPTFAEANARLAIAYSLQMYYGNVPYDQGQADILKYAERALDLDQNLAAGYAAMGLYYEGTENEKARDAYLKSLELNPNQPYVYNWLGNLYSDDLDDEEKGFEQYRKMYEVDPLAPLSIYNRARVSIYEENYEEAEFYFNKNLRENPEFILTYGGFSFLKSNMPVSRYDEAFKLIYKAHKLDANFSRSFRIMVSNLIAMELNSVAKYYIEKLRTDYPESNELHGITGYYGYMTGDYSYFEEYTLPFVLKNELFAQNAFNYHNLVALAIKKDDPDLAFDVFRKYDADLFSDDLVFKDDDKPWKGLALGKLYRYTGDVEASKSIANRFCDFAESLLDTEDKDSDEYLNPRMRCLIVQGKYDEAFPIFEKRFLTQRRFNSVMGLVNDSDPNITAMLKKPKYKAVVDQIQEELAEQKQNTINFLKKEGDWKKEWDEGN